MPINRAPFNALVDDDGSGLTGTVWNKTQIKDVILDPVDAAAYRADANIFTAQQHLQTPNPGIFLYDTSAAPGAKLFRVVNTLQAFDIAAMDDGYATVLAQCGMTRQGDWKAGRDVYEKGRLVAMGHWQNVPFAAANFGATGGGTWTVGAPAVIANRYTLIGKTLHWQIYVSWFSGSNAVAGAVTGLNIGLPSGIANLGTGMNAIAYGIDAGAPAQLYATVATGMITILKSNGAAFTAGAPGIVGTMTWEIA